MYREPQDYADIGSSPKLRTSSRGRRERRRKMAVMHHEDVKSVILEELWDLIIEGLAGRGGEVADRQPCFSLKLNFIFKNNTENNTK